VVIVDDIPQSFQAQAFTSLADVQQVEVLRGPQTTLLGKSSTAGAINITTQGPSDTFTALMNVMGTSDDQQLVQATVSGPIFDMLEFRISAGFNDFKGSLHNLTTGWFSRGLPPPPPTSGFVMTSIRGATRMRSGRA
jgi:iron complex outermembrane receptor protein